MDVRMEHFLSGGRFVVDVNVDASGADRFHRRAGDFFRRRHRRGKTFVRNVKNVPRMLFRDDKNMSVRDGGNVQKSDNGRILVDNRRGQTLVRNAAEHTLTLFLFHYLY